MNINPLERRFEGPLNHLNRPAQIDPTTVIRPNNALPLLHMKILFKALVAFAFIQYLCFFVGLPFEEVQNRPGISIISQLSLPFTVMSSVFILSIASVTVPTKQAYVLNVLGSFTQLVNLALSTGSLIVLWRLEGKIVIPVFNNNNEISKDIQPIDITFMLKVFSAVLLVINLATTGLSVTITYLYGIGLYRIANGIPRNVKERELVLNGQDPPDFEQPNDYFERQYGALGKEELVTKEIELEFVV